MANGKTQHKKEKCTCKNCSCTKDAFPICFLACVLTAVVISITFATSFALVFKYEFRHKYGLSFSGEYAEQLEKISDDAILKVEAGALIDFFESGHTGFVLATSDECTRCSNFEERLYYVASEKNTLASTVHYHYPANNDPTEYDDYAEEITLNGEEAPVLLYVKNGRIYDRLDEVNGEAGINAFLEKYK